MIDEKDDGRRPLPEQSGQQAGGFAREGAHEPKAQAGPPARAERRVAVPVGRGRLERRGDGGDRGLGPRELAVLGYMYGVLVALVALGVPTEIALTASFSAGAAAARLLGLI